MLEIISSIFAGISIVAACIAIYYVYKTGQLIKRSK